MRFLMSTKGFALVVGVVAVAGASVAAYAYFLAAGSGHGTFTSGRIGSVTIASDSAGPLYPQTSPSSATALTVHVTNNGNGPQHVGTIAGVVDPNSLPAGCQAGWFTIAPISSPGTLSPRETVDLGSSVILNDPGVNQNACANTQFTINWSSALN
jgi:hypothetical protein